AGPGSRHLREKLAVLSAFWPQALVRRKGFDDTPALDALCAHAAVEHPAAWRWEGERAEALRLGTAVTRDGLVTQTAAGRFGLGDEVARCLRGLPPDWRRAGLPALAFDEDLALLDAAGRTAWFAVSLPSHWAPPAKLDLDFAALHAPVADRALVVQAGPGLLQLARGPVRWERFVWNVTGHARLHAHPAHAEPTRWPDGAATEFPSAAWWRTERQTFLPLAGADALAFTIRVDVQALAAAIDSPARAARLHAAIGSMSPAVLDYRGLTPVRDALLGWLGSR
ncbi:MAG: heme-dependent oxidative N-demethylase subunit alpha family protein, partial [Rubrivivax sp.]